MRVFISLRPNKLCNDTNTDRRADPQLCKEMGIRSLLILPIKQNAKVVGVLEVLSINPNAFNQHDATAISKLADRVLPLPSESATIPDRCLDQLASKDIEAVRDLQKLLAHADVPKERNNRLRTTDAAEAPGWNGHYIGSQLPDQPVTMTTPEHPSGARWLTIGLAIALTLVICGYGYHLNHPRVATNVAILPVAAANHKPAIPDQQQMLSEQDKKINGQPKASDSVLTATRQELILAIQEAVQGTDVNRILNRADVGDSIAQYEMALRYADGEGVPQNYRDAMAWFAKDRSQEWGCPSAGIQLAGAQDAESCPAGHFPENCHARCIGQVKIVRAKHHDLKDCRLTFAARALDGTSPPHTMNL